MMTTEEWDQWALLHTTVFGMDAQDLEMVNTWQRAFQSRGYTFHDLEEATYYLAANNPPKWRDKHLAAIHARIIERRMNRANLESKQAERRAEDCKRCSDSGVVMVPHLKAVRNGEWFYPFYEMGVFCNCYRGRTKFNKVSLQCEAMVDHPKSAHAFKPNPLDILAYEQRNPDWECQVQTRQLVRDEAVKSEAMARDADRTRGPLRFDATEILRRYVRQPGDEVEE